MNKTVAILPSEQLAVFARLAHVLEEATTLIWEISTSTEVMPSTLPEDIEALAETDPALADTMALMFNTEAKMAIEESIHAYKAGKARPITEFFDELHALR